MAEGFKMGAAFVDITTEDNTRDGRAAIGGAMTRWAGSLHVGEIITDDMAREVKQGANKVASAAGQVGDEAGKKAGKGFSDGMKVAAAAAGVAVGAVISKGVADNLEIGQANAKLGAQLGTTKAVAGEAGKVAGEVYRDNFGASIPEVNAAISSIGMNLVDLNEVGSAELKGLTEAALGIADVFNQDVNEVVRAAGQLVKNNLAPDFMSAMDMITRGFQSGGDVAGDFLETINEYAPQFAKLGFDGQTALGLVSQALKAGARDTDVVADAFKEFGIRAIDTATLTTEGYQAIGLNADEMRNKIAAGGAGAQDAMLQVLRALQSMQDPVAQNAAGVALFGTQWEDTMRTILPGMDLTEAALTDVEGATKRMNDQMGDTGAAKVESVKRSMEGWVTSMTSLDGPMGTISSWLVGFAPTALPMITSVAQIGMAVKVMGVGVSLSFLSTLLPILLVVAAVGALTFFIIKNWDAIAAVTNKVWDAIWRAISDFITMITGWVKARIDDIVGFFQMLGRLPGKVRQWFLELVIGAQEKLGELVSWVRSLPGKLLGALGNLGKILWNAGASIIRGLWEGLKSAWNAVTGWLSDLGGWIADLKGPIEVDAVILVPHGKAFMKGLAGGLEAGFDTEVRPQLAGMTEDIANTTLPVPAGSAPLAAGTTSTGAPTAGNTITIENLTVTFPGSLNAMSRSDLRSAAEFVRDQIRAIERGERVA